MTSPSHPSAHPACAVFVPYVGPRCARLQSLTSVFCQAGRKGFPVVIRSTVSANTQDCCEGIHSFFATRFVVSASCRVLVQEITSTKARDRVATALTARRSRPVFISTSRPNCHSTAETHAGGREFQCGPTTEIAP